MVYSLKLKCEIIQQLDCKHLYIQCIMLCYLSQLLSRTGAGVCTKHVTVAPRTTCPTSWRAGPRAGRGASTTSWCRPLSGSASSAPSDSPSSTTAAVVTTTKLNRSSSSNNNNKRPNFQWNLSLLILCGMDI